MVSFGKCEFYLWNKDSQILSEKAAASLLARMVRHARLAESALSLKNILFATDFSRQSRLALTFALPITRKYGATVYAAHVVPEPIGLPYLHAKVCRPGRNTGLLVNDASVSGNLAARIVAMAMPALSY